MGYRQPVSKSVAQPKVQLRDQLAEHRAMVEEMLRDGRSASQISNYLEMYGIEPQAAAEYAESASRNYYGTAPAPAAAHQVNRGADDADHDHANPGLRNLSIGFLSVLIGGGITLCSYNSAAEGGTYFILYGAILVGLYEIILGIYQLSNQGSS